MSGLKREDEYKLKQLQQQAQDEGRQNMAEDDQLLLLLLEDRYSKFLDEGLRKLRETSPTSPRGLSRLFSSSNNSKRPTSAKEPSPNSTPAPSNDAASNDSIMSAPSGTPGANNGCFAFSNPPAQASGKHWTWILDNLVVGAIPYAAPTPDTPGHLCELLEQCFQRKSMIAVVVSCIDVEESTPPGFALAKDWETILNTNTFLHCSVIPNGSPSTNVSFSTSSLLAPAAAPSATAEGGSGESSQSVSASLSSSTRVDAFENMLQLCQHVDKLLKGNNNNSSSSSVSPNHHQSGSGKSRLSFARKDTTEKRRVAYIHCKAGATRSWVFTMCYLLSQLQRPYEECEAYLRSLRSFYPKPFQIEFVKQFAQYLEQPREPEMSADEEKYVRILADVLSLPQKFRLKLLSDLEKLT